MYNKQLDAFIKVADLGSFSKAAKDLYISPNAIIQQINLLEKSLDVQLFIRNSRGVKLTDAGKSIYKDASNIIQQSLDAVERAQIIATKSNNKIRVGASLLNKCRFLPDLWEKMISIHPEIKIEIISLRNSEEATRSPLTDLGVDYDIREGFYFAKLFQNRGNFFKILYSPICAAFTQNHDFSKQTNITADDFADKTIVMVQPGISEEFDMVRNVLQEMHPNLKIIDVPTLDINVFTMCEFNDYALITTEIWSDIHPALTTRPVNWDFSIPYGFIYPLNPPKQVESFVSLIKEIFKHKNR